MTVAKGLTVTVAVPVFTQPVRSLTVTIYVVVVVTLEVGFAMFGSLSPVDGLHE